MKVGICRKCKHFRERRWVQYYEPKHYHAIGMAHVYAYCARLKKRCVEVKNNDCIPNQMMIFDGVKED